MKYVQLEIHFLSTIKNWITKLSHFYKYILVRFFNIEDCDHIQLNSFKI